MFRSPTTDQRPAVFILSDGVICQPNVPGQPFDSAIHPQPAAPLEELTSQGLLFGALEGLRTLARIQAPVILLTERATSTNETKTIYARRADLARQTRLRQALCAEGANIEALHSFLTPLTSSTPFTSPTSNPFPLSPLSPLSHASRNTDRTRAYITEALRRSARIHALDLSASIIISTRATDLEAGLSLGCQPIAISTFTHNLIQQFSPALRARVWYAADLAMAALCIAASFRAHHNAHHNADQHPFTFGPPTITEALFHVG